MNSPVLHGISNIVRLGVKRCQCSFKREKKEMGTFAIYVGLFTHKNAHYDRKLFSVFRLMH